jgi:hypothetical protein
MLDTLAGPENSKFRDEFSSKASKWKLVVFSSSKYVRRLSREAQLSGSDAEAKIRAAVAYRSRHISVNQLREITDRMRTIAYRLQKFQEQWYSSIGSSTTTN